MRLKKNSRENIIGFTYILPSLLITIAFFIVPIIMSLYYSFHEYNVIQPLHFIALDNYKRLFKDPIFWISLKNTFYYTLIVVPVQTMLALFLAVLITSCKKNIWISVVKGSLFIPVISSMILVGIIWRIIYNPDIGFANAALQFLKLSPLNWLGTTKSALPSIMMVAIWKDTGYFMIIYIAGILEIPDIYYEAAKVDGADNFQKFWKITLPLLKNSTLFVVLLGTIWSFQVFELVYSLTGGGPGFSTMTLVMHIYNSSFRQFKMGYGTTLAYVLFVIVVTISIFQMKLLKNNDEGIY